VGRAHFGIRRESPPFETLAVEPGQGLLVTVRLGLLNLRRDPGGLLAVALRWGLRRPTARVCFEGLAHPLFLVGEES
jgi:hypothetical protein